MGLHEIICHRVNSRRLFIVGLFQLIAIRQHIEELLALFLQLSGADLGCDLHLLDHLYLDYLGLGTFLLGNLMNQCRPQCYAGCDPNTCSRLPAFLPPLDNLDTLPVCLC